jgi:hypothetical protein
MNEEAFVSISVSGTREVDDEDIVVVMVVAVST